MNKYTIELKLHTLALCATDQDGVPNQFRLDGLMFQHWDFTWVSGHKAGAWLISSKIPADNFRKAVELFMDKLNAIVPKISLISQCYTEYTAQPFLVRKEGSDFGCFRWIKSCEAVGLYFSNEQLRALELLVKNKEFPREFFYYWNDMVNAIGYAAKLLLFFAALDSLEPNRKKRRAKYDEILGKELAEKLLKGNDFGIRHRLVHGNYFSQELDKENYLDLTYAKVIKYFNEKIFGDELITKKVKDPQRHSFGNNEGWQGFINLLEYKEFGLKKLMNKCDEEGIDCLDVIAEPEGY